MENNVLQIMQDARRQRLNELRTHRLEEEDTQNQEEAQENDNSMLTYSKLLELHGETAIFQFTGFTNVEFNEIYNTVADCMKQTGRGKRFKLDYVDMLLITLSWLQSGLRHREMCHIFSITQPMLQRVIHHTIVAITDPLVAKFVPKSPSAYRSNKRFAHFPHCIGAVDVALIETVRPKQNQKLYYSVKHQSHGIKLQACVAPDGVCIDFQIGWPGSIHDKKCFDESRLLNRLTWQCMEEDGSMTVKHYGCLFDRGYTGVQNENYREAVVTKRKPRGGELSDADLERNRKIESDRVIVENYFMRLRQRFGIMQKKFRGDRANLLHRIVAIGVALTNFYNTRHPMRGNQNNQDNH